MKKYFYLLLPVLILFMLISGCTHDRVAVAKPLYYQTARDYAVAVERNADYPVTYRPKMNEAPYGSIVSQSP